ncbi:LuxR C-terminal-related transcriptional regulator [Microbacterium sp. EYE_5]|uniref:LuxR C-terminal-related transcriptional regulator n=1 Tax=unclassified Microbacterium TaxID=2609290 RepID=UPI0020055E16|nr:MULTISPECIES: LuxR C-terminal-related transcriptional regulator [unclassified Microbacterium]MCK6081233.1 LuxR C-terminal-related transcriptional regulator [Microbacterium sp. EYE_382]MCK6086503.1 LuxR C-terminal-related transcriptional regulator [Microbacterium sp. EYE_384]MCK6123999.1 LuxR C-terminal-related transcriptional regulator [Microbacterium sp. EYE_80]MCK6126908.1 LuxR C-terminal-related transcriptional regulator [Microbacterium sp. EYE_79]MCK6142188.1 LuxR C-terminal-related tra
MGSSGQSDADTQLVSRAVSDLARQTRFPVVFGGLEHDGAVHVTAIAGTRTRSIDGLVVRSGRGLGGAAMVEKRPRLALDYRTARTITHDYDRAILGEGISTLLAVPVVVTGRPRGIVYCGSWTPGPVGDLVSRPAFRAADMIATELRVRDEVDRRLAALAPAEPALPPAAQEDLRESYAELRSIAASVTDARLRDRIAAVERRLAGISRDASTDASLDVTLSPRELDVLACCALGSTNAEIGATLALKEGTVKSYLQAAMAKLDASTRHAAVAKARRAGLLP